MIDREDRVHYISRKKSGTGPVVYWMSRDQRLHDNWALLYARQKAAEKKTRLLVVFSLTEPFLGAIPRHFQFMLRGLQQVEQGLHERGIPFFLLHGEPPATISRFISDNAAGLMVSDFDPLHIKRKWISEISRKTDISIHQVDAHNIVPCRIAYPDRAAFGAYVIRKPIVSRLHDYLGPFPELPDQKSGESLPENDWSGTMERFRLPGDPILSDRFEPGYSAGMTILGEFIRDKLDLYETLGGNPEKDCQSGLSAYLHYGQIAPQRAAYEIEQAQSAGTPSALEQLIVRRELSDNWCLNTPGYDTIEGFPDWARRTLDDHRNDAREYLYSLQQLEEAKTHDPLWNAAQLEMTKLGKMHGYMRMYWAKKILEWTVDPESALHSAMYLNDKYSIDGRDPNGYAGIAWSIGGVHDRPWAERPVFGKIRYMNDRGARRKFDTGAYIDRVNRQIES